MSEGWQLGPYDGREVLSALRKAVVLADVGAAVYWCHVCLTFGGKGGQRLVARQLWIIASEIVDEDAALLRAAAVMQHAGSVKETDSLFFTVARLCKAAKWWETEEGRQVDMLWSQAVGDLKRDPRPVPAYALDRHTRRGWELVRSGEHFDDRFSGDDLGRAKTAYLWARDGEISDESRVDGAFWPVWRDRRALQGDDLPDPTPNQPETEQGRLL